MTTEITDQPAPVRNDRVAIADLVLGDVAERKRLGIERYGVALQAGNGRDALVDAYQEVLDLAMYVRQEIEERNTPRRVAIADLFRDVNLVIRPDGVTLELPDDVALRQALTAKAAEYDELADQLRRTRIELDHWRHQIVPEIQAERDGLAAQLRRLTEAQATDDKPTESEAVPVVNEPAAAVVGTGPRCAGEGCGHYASSHVSYRKRRQQRHSGCEECDCPRSQERVLQQQIPAAAPMATADRTASIYSGSK